MNEKTEIPKIDLTSLYIVNPRTVIDDTNTLYIIILVIRIASYSVH